MTGPTIHTVNTYFGFEPLDALSPLVLVINGYKTFLVC